MARPTLNPWRRILAALPNIWWGLLLAIHVPILFAVLASVLREGLDFSRIGSGFALAVATAFFVLKLRDVSFLRLRTRQQSFVVACLLTAIVHHNAVVPGVDSSLVMQGTALVATTQAVRELLRRRPSPIAGLAARLAAFLATPRLMPAPVAACECERATVSSRAPSSPTAPRAPPV